jgi:hypothetical protein
MNPQDNTATTVPNSTEIGTLELMRVTTANAHQTPTDQIEHHVQVQRSLFEEPQTAVVMPTQIGDIYVPQEGDLVIVGHRTDGPPVILGSYYSADYSLPLYKPGERRIGHPASDSYIRLKQNGTIQIQHDTPANKTAVVRFQQDGGVAMHDHKGYGIECQNNGEVHIYGKVKQHTSQTLDLAE